MRGLPEQKFRELFDRHFRDVLGYALRRVDSPEDAADVLADTMLVAWRRIREVPAAPDTRPWLYGVARRVLANHRRGQVRRERLGERLRHQLVDVTPDIAGEVTSSTAIRTALAGLNEDDRELIELTAWEGLEPRDIAVVFGLPSRTVRTRLHRARARLREEIGDAFHEDGHVRDEELARIVKEER